MYSTCCCRCLVIHLFHSFPISLPVCLLADVTEAAGATAKRLAIVQVSVVTAVIHSFIYSFYSLSPCVLADVTEAAGATARGRGAAVSHRARHGVAGPRASGARQRRVGARARQAECLQSASARGGGATEDREDY